MPLRYILILLCLPILACGSFLNEAKPAARPTTQVKLVRFNTPTPTLTPPPTAAPSPAPPTATPTIIPTALALTLPPTPVLTETEGIVLDETDILTETEEIVLTGTEEAVLSETEEPVGSEFEGPELTVEEVLAAEAAAASSETESPALSSSSETTALLPSPVPPAAVETQAAPSPLSPGQYHLGYGVQLADAKHMALAVQGGFSWAKHDLNLRKDINYLANADNLLSDLRKHGTGSVLLKLVVWNREGLPDAPRTAEEVQTFAANAAEVAKFIRGRYDGVFKGIAYEVWNEPNLNFEWEGNPNPVEYIALLRATAEAIRQADPQAVVVSGAPSPGGDYDDLKFLEAMYANGAKGLMDAVGSHPYGGPWPYDHPTGIDEAGNGWPYFRKAEAQRAIMEKYGDIATPIWATEFSWLAGLSNCDFGEHTRWQVTPQQQADYLVAAYAYAHQNWPWMGPMFVVFDFAISGRYDRCHPAAGYSILRPDPASSEITTLASQALFAMPKYSAW